MTPAQTAAFAAAADPGMRACREASRELRPAAVISHEELGDEDRIN
jgi:hypothetical protein